MKEIHFEEKRLKLLDDMGIGKDELDQSTNHLEINPEDVPIGNLMVDIERRRSIISKYYHDWKLHNPSLRKFNLSLNDYINIRFVSITETCTHASRTYLSTLAVMQLDAILTNAKVVSTVPSKNNGNQKPFEKIIIMKYDCVGIGIIKMTVGVRRRTHEKVQYCITALKTEKDVMTTSL